MNILQQLPKDPDVAREILASLEEKDKDGNICRYPTCHAPRQTTITITPGQPRVFCSDPDHNATNNRQARLRLKETAESEITTTTALPVILAPVESLRGSIVARITQLQTEMERYLAILVSIADPDLSAAQMKATLDRAESRIAEAQQNVSAERSLRLASDSARQAAQIESQSAREAADLAIAQKDEAIEQKAIVDQEMQRLIEETEQAIATTIAERNSAIEQIRSSSQEQIRQIEMQSQEAISDARGVALVAEEKARQAEVHAREIETEAHKRIASAERLAVELQATLKREQLEVDRLRTELVDIRVQAERDRTDARTLLEREQREVDRLRTELKEATRKRSDNDTIGV